MLALVGILSMDSILRVNFLRSTPTASLDSLDQKLIAFILRLARDLVSTSMRNHRRISTICPKMMGGGHPTLKALIRNSLTRSLTALDCTQTHQQQWDPECIVSRCPAVLLVLPVL